MTTIFTMVLRHWCCSFSYLPPSLNGVLTAPHVYKWTRLTRHLIIRRITPMLLMNFIGCGLTLFIIRMSCLYNNADYSNMNIRKRMGWLTICIRNHYIHYSFSLSLHKWWWCVDILTRSSRVVFLRNFYLRVVLFTAYSFTLHSPFYNCLWPLD